jgi:hypothetical protein
MPKHVRLSIPDEIRLYAFQLKKDLKFDTIEQAYYLILNVGMKALHKNIKKTYVDSHPNRGRKRESEDLYDFTVKVERKAKNEKS